LPNQFVIALLGLRNQKARQSKSHNKDHELQKMMLQSQGYCVYRSLLPHSCSKLRSNA
jgi:hypothetical protein